MFEAAFKALRKSSNKSILDLVFPVGALFMSTSSANPGTLIGGTWEAWGAGRVVTGIDTTQTEFNTVEKTGGAKSHVQTEAEMAYHYHKLFTSTGGSTTIPAWTSKDNGTSGSTEITTGIASSTTRAGGTAGVTQAMSLLQPYITAYIWKRTA